ncbi:MAG: hypothetical protein JW776_14765, partial [Candidatus Lokiarchaeota archaeon]|nr:hypothetical protein [Candidatus Lokiarchaeota archaeon]
MMFARQEYRLVPKSSDGGYVEPGYIISDFNDQVDNIRKGIEKDGIFYALDGISFIHNYNKITKIPIYHPEILILAQEFRKTHQDYIDCI